MNYLELGTYSHAGCTQQLAVDVDDDHCHGDHRSRRTRDERHGEEY